MTYNKIVNGITGEEQILPLTTEEIAEREAYERDVLPGEIRQRIRSNRAAAYTTEADPLFFKAQRGEATIEEWEAKVAEIRTRYPYPALEVTP